MKKRRGTLFILIIMLSALQEYTYLVRRIGFHYFYIITQSLDDRPFVYRALLPYLTRAVNTLTGLNVYFCMGLLILLSSIGLYYSIKYL